MIFVHILVGHSVRATAERWQHSLSTISLVIHEVCGCFMQVREHLYIKPLQNTIPARIQTDPKYSPYFNNCIGALDGSRIPAYVPLEEQ